MGRVGIKKMYPEIVAEFYNGFFVLFLGMRLLKNQSPGGAL